MRDTGARGLGRSIGGAAPAGLEERRRELGGGGKSLALHSLRRVRQLRQLPPLGRGGPPRRSSGAAPPMCPKPNLRHGVQLRVRQVLEAGGAEVAQHVDVQLAVRPEPALLPLLHRLHALAVQACAGASQLGHGRLAGPAPCGTARWLPR
jgi:hypothetical protein